ncbi:glyoxalase/bleomycin resistance/extradiol dioxygenase family protein [Rudanella paleaurantiibacter]|uniref:Glyoxalase/bleomycin resistance/extradiol dioxygenase family protein n=1 Tax=Rudanella paleaurantiibacter TaxID=2614655 RepID=A0A7J5U0B8_9BACT|nr:VOC family protein [Rudanella paleaurantiibacter]KAB7731140.1 glyoxalase/bleomycin resistance/extradiol dioxygenase family protein [Rudanella paleaurantiibacter]
MATQIFVNLPVRSLDRSVAFFTQLGYTFNPQFTDEKATCMVISDTIYVMLLVEPFFCSFTKKSIADTTQTAEVIVSLSADSREAVDAIVDKAVAAGANTPVPAQDHGFMYERSFEDLDGHSWSYVYMDMAAVTDASPTEVGAGNEG